MQTMFASKALSKKYDYSWLFKFADASTNELWLDKRFDMLLNQVVPVQRVDLLGEWKSLKDTMKCVIHGIPNDVIVTDKRYISMSACRYQSATEKGFIGIDVNTRKSICGVVHYFSKNSEEMTEQPQLYLASNNYATYNEVAEPLKTALKKWLVDEKVTPSKSRFSNGPSIVELPRAL
jgi:hypothetical protein